MSYNPCRFQPFSLPDYETLPPGVELLQYASAPNPFLFDRGTAQFVRARVPVPISVAKVKPNPPTNLSFSKIQDPWHQFGLKWQAPCNVWSRHEVAPRPDGNMYGVTDTALTERPALEKSKRSELEFAMTAIAVIALGTVLLGSRAPRR
jgi:hypothetical protein